MNDLDFVSLRLFGRRRCDPRPRRLVVHQPSMCSPRYNFDDCSLRTADPEVNNCRNQMG